MDELAVSRDVIVANPQGLHARPADAFVRLANSFTSKVSIVKDGERVDGKSILAVLTLAALKGTKLSIEASGQDAEAALEALVELIEQDSDEEKTDKEKTFDQQQTGESI